MAFLRLKEGKKVSSLEEFRQNFNFTIAKDYLRQGRLSRWVRDLGEAELADELDELKDADYSDQTLLDNFVGIFGLEPANAVQLSPSESSQETESLPVPATSICHVSPVLVSGAERAPESGDDDPVFFSDSMVFFKKSLAMRGVEGKTPAAIHRYLENMTVLMILRRVVPKNLPPRLYEEFEYQQELNESTCFFKDLDFDKDQLSELAQQLNDKFDMGDVQKFYVSWDATSLEYEINAGVSHVTTVGELLDILTYRKLKLKSYNDDEAQRLLKGEI